MKKLLLTALVMTLALGVVAQARTGAWVDEVVFFQEPTPAKAVEMVRTGAADLFTAGVVAPALVRTVTEHMGHEIAYGTFREISFEISFNPFGPKYRDGRLNPFSVPAVREAMNWLIDRDFLVQKFHGGVAGVPRFFPLSPAFPDYAKLAGVARRLELKYAYDPARAAAVIGAEMAKLGATLVGGKWHYAGAPVTVRFIIRVEDERRQIGDYVATQLEGIGFTTDRRYLTAAEASPIWMTGDPSLGLFDVVTGTWITTGVDRDQADVFNLFYTPRGLPLPLWQAYKPEPEFDTLAGRLARGDFATTEERLDMMARALELAMEDSVRVWLMSRV